MKTIAIIDDNRSIRSAIRTMIEHNFPKQFNFDEASGIVQGFQLLRKKKFDIVLLDVEMDDGTGVEMMESFGDFDFKLIFVTGHKEYALNAIKLRATDYILKPINPLELVKVINSVLLEDETKLDIDSSKILINSLDSTVIVESGEIIRCEADGGYTSVYLSNGKKVFSSRNLKYFEERLDKNKFLRIHHAHLINSDFILEVSRHGNDGVILKNQDKIPISVRKKSVLSDFLSKFK